MLSKRVNPRVAAAIITSSYSFGLYIGYRAVNLQCNYFTSSDLQVRSINEVIWLYLATCFFSHLEEYNRILEEIESRSQGITVLEVMKRSAVIFGLTFILSEIVGIPCHFFRFYVKDYFMPRKSHESGVSQVIDVESSVIYQKRQVQEL